MSNQVKQKPPELQADAFPDSLVTRLLGDPGTCRSFIILALLTAALLVPFSGKAFHIDDTVFLRIAHQITDHPFDPYGGSINWFGREVPVSKSMDNPPLASYYIAAVAFFFGWSENALHLSFMPFAIAFVLGTYALARRSAAPPLLAALASLFSPSFLVSSTNIMCDTMMASLFIWSLVMWIDGITSRSPRRLLAAGILVTLAALTKYYAISAIPLMAAYAIAKRRSDLLPILFLAIPPGVLFGYERWTEALYGQGMLNRAAQAAGDLRWIGDQKVWTKFFIGLSFSGAVTPCVLFFSRRLFSRRQLAGGAMIAIAAALLLTWSTETANAGIDPLRLRLILFVELVLLVSAGLGTLALGMITWRRGIAPETVLLSLWLLGTFVYSSFVNWTINEPPLMLLGPPTAILLSRRVVERGRPSVRLVAASLTAAAVLSLAVCWGDYSFAGAGRIAAERIMSQHRPGGAVVWFQGHWGFQHYMEKLGAQAVDFESSIPAPGDLIVLPGNNTNVSGMQQGYVSSSEFIEVPVSGWVTTMHSGLNAGFYSHYWGPVPFVFGPMPLEKYDIVTYGEPQTNIHQ